VLPKIAMNHVMNQKASVLETDYTAIDYTIRL